MAQEVEIKRLLDTAGYAALQAQLDALTPPVRHAQVNHYLDLPDAALRQLGAMLRLRVVGDKLVLTLKAKANVTAGVLRAQELERSLTDPHERAFWQQAVISWPQAVARLGDWLDQAGLHALADRADDLRSVGATANLRLIYQLPDGIDGWPTPLTLELDRTRYPGDVERLELECEHADALRLAPLLDAWLAAHGVLATAATETKYAQFLRLADAG